MSRTSIADLVLRTIEALRDATLPLTMPGSSEMEASRKQLLTQLESRILPHINEDDVPTIIVFGGSSGAGKSTLVNSIVRTEVTQASVIRPTTRTPMLVMHPSDHKVMDDHVLGSMGQSVFAASAIPGVVLVDAPDLDSVEDSNRELSARLLDAADLWIFVTTAARYGDALAWNTLRRAHERGVTCAIVLDRVPRRAMQSVRTDLTKRMIHMGLENAPLFIITDQGAHDGLLPENETQEIRAWLDMIATTNMGESLIDRTTRATLPALRDELLRLADALEAQEHAIQDLKDKALESVQPPLEKLRTNIRHGRFGQGAPTASWLSFASTGGVLSAMVSRNSPRLFDRKRTARDNAVTVTFDILYAALKVALSQALVAARTRADEAWRNDVVDTATLRAQANQEIDIDSIIEKSAQAWKNDLVQITQQVHDHPWLSPAGIASLLGCAAGGISGAISVARNSGIESYIEQAREALLARVDDALAELSNVYVRVADEVSVCDSTQLRLRASEYLAHV